ncbi:VOC family protein [Leifsonia poae]|uniref:VOC family protein n=1 Tax=Leifsonia poae TaxID=110933 RepID=UPI003D6739C6
MIGTLESLVIDCPDPRELARFYSKLLGLEIVQYDDDWAEIVEATGNRPIIAFQQVAAYNPPQWPSQDVPQQMHLDVKVDDLDAGRRPCWRSGRPRPVRERPRSGSTATRPDIPSASSTPPTEPRGI